MEFHVIQLVLNLYKNTEITFTLLVLPVEGWKFTKIQ